MGPEPRDGDLVRRRVQDQLRAGDRGERDRFQGSGTRDVARSSTTARSWRSPRCTTSTRFASSGACRLHGRTVRDQDLLSRRTLRSKAAPVPELYKLGEGPLYPFWIPYHLPHFETPNAIARVALLDDNVAPPLAGPVVEVCAVAKRDLKADEVLDEYGMYMTYGEAANATR